MDAPRDGQTCRTTIRRFFFRKKNTKNTDMNSICQLLLRINFKVSPSNIHLNNKKLIPVTRCKLDDLQSLKELPCLLIFTVMITIYQEIMSHKIIVMYL